MPDYRAQLPEVIADIAEVAGIDAAMAIAHAKGGHEVFIPAHAKPQPHWLAEIVGLDAAVKICDFYRVNDNGTKLVIPMASAARRKEVWFKALQGDTPVNQIASQLGVHRRTVFRHIKQKKSDDQGELF